MYQRDPKKPKLGMGPMAPQQITPLAAAPAPVQAQKGAVEQFGDMAKTQLMTKGLDKGMAYGGDLISKAMAPSAAQSALTIGGAPAAQAGGLAAGGGLQAAMGAAGTAMPYVGIGLLGAKMLGLFSKGGYVGPLASIAYKSEGGKITANFYNSTKE